VAIHGLKNDDSSELRAASPSATPPFPTSAMQVVMQALATLVFVELVAGLFRLLPVRAS